MSRSAQFVAQVRRPLPILRHKRTVCPLPPSSQQTAEQGMTLVQRPWAESPWAGRSEEPCLE